MPSNIQITVMDKSSELFHTVLKTDCAEIVKQFSQQSVVDVYIDSLTLDLGEITLHDFETQLRQRFQQQFRQQLLIYSDGYKPTPEQWLEEQGEAGGLYQKISEQPLLWKRRLARACLDAKKRQRVLALLSRKGGEELCNLLNWKTPVTLQGLLLQGLGYFQQHPHLLLPPPREDALMVIAPEQDDGVLKALFSSPPSPALLPWLSALWRQLAVRQALENSISTEVAGLVQKKGREHKPEPAQEQEQEAAQSKQLPVFNAGLVTLWPLLPDLFQRLGLWEKGAFTQDNARQSAASCLDWLIWQDEPDEQRMVFTQWLCGLPLNEACQREEVTPQLQSVLQAWLAQLPLQLAGWRTLSVENVRALFLQRSGTLVVQEKGWLLHVDPQPFDLLLVDWPWPLTNLMLPWLPAAIDIDWPQPGFDRAEAHYA